MEGVSCYRGRGILLQEERDTGTGEEGYWHRVRNTETGRQESGAEDSNGTGGKGCWYGGKIFTSAWILVQGVEGGYTYIQPCTLATPVSTTPAKWNK
jgi:hypothetical protein